MMFKAIRNVRPDVVRSIAGAIFVNIGLVMMITLGNLSTYVTSYIRYVNGDLTIHNEDIGWVMLFGMVSGSIGTFLCAMLERPLKTRASTFLGCCIYVSGTMLSYFSIQKSFSLFVVTYGVMAGTGTIWAWGASVQNAIQWVPDNPSIASGVVSGACGFGAVIFSMVMTAFINPTNLSPEFRADDGNTYFTDEKLLARVPSVFLLLGTIYGALQMGGVLLMLNVKDDQLSSIKQGKKHKRLKSDADAVDEKAMSATQNGEVIELQRTASGGGNDRYGATATLDEQQDIEKAKESSQKATARSSENDGLLNVISYVLKKGDTYVVWFYCIVTQVGMIFVLEFYKVYGQTFISDDVFLASVGSIGGLSEIFMRPLWGILMDKCSLEVAMKVIAAFITVLIGTLALTEYMGKASFFIWIFGLFAGTTSMGPLTAGGLIKLYGTKNVIVTFAIFNIALNIATFVSIETTLLLRDIVGWHGVFLVYASLSTIGFFITFLLHGKDEEDNPY